MPPTVAGGAQPAGADEGQVSGRGAGWGLPVSPRSGPPTADALALGLCAHHPPHIETSPRPDPRPLFLFQIRTGGWDVGQRRPEAGVWGEGGLTSLEPQNPGCKETAWSLGTDAHDSMEVASHSGPRHTPAAFTARPRQVRPQGALSSIVGGPRCLSGGSSRSTGVGGGGAELKRRGGDRRQQAGLRRGWDAGFSRR